MNTEHRREVIGLHEGTSDRLICVAHGSEQEHAPARSSLHGSFFHAQHMWHRVVSRVACMTAARAAPPDLTAACWVTLGREEVEECQRSPSYLCLGLIYVGMSGAAGVANSGGTGLLIGAMIVMLLHERRSTVEV